MKHSNYPENWPDINCTLYHRSVQLFSAVKNLLSVNIELHADTQLLQGDIFLFNHFSRFETFIPQFLIFEKTGAHCCSIASSEFFDEDNVLSSYLKHLGVFPHDHPRLFSILAGQILRGRKVIIFPEGGMVKDRHVVDKNGQYSIYSRITHKKRKHHTGAAVLGQGVEAIKSAIRHAFKENKTERLQYWQELLEFDNLDELMATALKPTLIVPSNITFYPIRNSENLLFKSIDLFSSELNQRQSEELLIESNIILKDTSMDIRMGNPINPCCVWDWRTHFVMNKVAPGIKKIDDVFNLTSTPRNWKERLLGHYFIKNAHCSRNQYMHSIYANVTVNLCHLASTLIMILVNENKQFIKKSQFYAVLYVTIKKLQKTPNIHLHSSLLNPDEYGNLIQGVNSRFQHFICIAKEADLIMEKNESYHFLEKLCDKHHIDQIRLENLIAVYNNETAPLTIIHNTLLSTNRAYHKINKQQLAAWHFEDEMMDLAFEKQSYHELHNSNLTIKQQETAMADPRTFLIQPKNPNGFGVLLIHGLLASPAELRDYADYLAKLGYTVLGIRLKGHGTSPYALRDLSFEQWFQSVNKGFNILKSHCNKLFVIGFSTGAALAIKLAAEQPDTIIGLVAVSVPIKFVSSTFMLIPLLHNANNLVQWVSSLEGIKPFMINSPEHPDINYHNIAVRALYELRSLIQHTEMLLPEINVPCLVMQANQDPIVALKSANTVFEKLGTQDKQLHIIKAKCHGILMENKDNIWSTIDTFLIQQQSLTKMD
ncbi:MAG: alpha/beta hydrolase [Methylococcaceae bacterium]|nr:alpha/beta hydrolase [Methylococcaceae bacterium]